MSKTQKETRNVLLQEALNSAAELVGIEIIHPDLPDGGALLHFPVRSLPHAEIYDLAQACGGSDRMHDAICEAIIRIQIEDALLSCITNRQRNV